MKYELSNLEKNRYWREVRDEFRQFGFTEDFFYHKNGTATIIYRKKGFNEKRFLAYCQKKGIKFNETLSHQTKDQSQEKKLVNTIQNPSFNYYKSEEFGKNITDFRWSNEYNDLFKVDGADTSIKLTTIYPGLLIGSGYNHPVVKDDKQDTEGYQLGFFFDHTTGLPLITGSSIKGVLNHIVSKPDVLQALYGEIIEKKQIKIEEFQAIFDNKKTEQNKETIFYDAYIIATKDKDNKIFGSDYITTHHPDDPMGQFKDPTPIKFLKILPEVTWQFQFKVEAKYIELLKSILLDFGVGAKTNVGYGQFKE